MSKVNFVSEFNLFMRYACDNSLSLRSRMLWMALFYIANDRAKYNELTKDYDWPDDFILVSNNELNMYCCLDKRAIETLRNELKQRGLIDFVPGQKNKRNPAYKLNYLSVDIGYKIVPNYDPNNVPNHTPNNVPNYVPNYDPNQPPLYKYNINSHTDTGIEDYIDDDADVDVVYARVREEVKNTYRNTFHQAPTVPELEEMTRIICLTDLQAVASDVIWEVGGAAPTNRLAYLTAVCGDWKDNYIRTKEDLMDHQTLRSLEKTFPRNAAEYATASLEAREKRRIKYTEKGASA